MSKRKKLTMDTPEIVPETQSDMIKITRIIFVINEVSSADPNNPNLSKRPFKPFVSIAFQKGREVQGKFVSTGNGRINMSENEFNTLIDDGDILDKVESRCYDVLNNQIPGVIGEEA